MDTGALKIEWAGQYMPVLTTISDRFKKEKPFTGLYYWDGPARRGKDSQPRKNIGRWRSNCSYNGFVIRYLRRMMCQLH